jgi:uncharacterized protein YegJ (DUF2314 family)
MENIDKGYTLVNAQVMAELHPQTFEAPTKEDLDKLESGDIVKLCFEDSEGEGSERMWVTVTSVSGDTLTGVLDNTPFMLECITYGDPVQFKKENIYTIF